MDISKALRLLSEQVLKAGDDNLPILLNGAADEISDLKAKIAEQAAYIENLRIAWDAVKKYDWDEPLDEAFEMTPAQCLAEHDAGVCRKAFIAGVNVTGEGYNGEHGLSEDGIIDLANLYVDRKIRQQASK